MYEGIQPQLSFNWDIVCLHHTNPDSIEIISTRAKSSAIPARITEVQKRFYAGKEYTYPSRDVSPRIFRMTVWDDENLSVWRAYTEWYLLMNDNEKNANQGRDQYMGDFIIKLLNTAGDPMERPSRERPKPPTPPKEKLSFVEEFVDNVNNRVQKGVQGVKNTVNSVTGKVSSLFSAGKQKLAKGVSDARILGTPGIGVGLASGRAVVRYMDRQEAAFQATSLVAQRDPDATMIIRLNNCFITEISEAVLSYSESGEITFDVLLHYSEMVIVK